MTALTDVSVVVLMPLSPQYDGVRNAVEHHLRDVGARSVNAYSHGLPGSGMTGLPEAIHRTIQKADMVVADISGSDPNVMYEVGFAHALKKPVLLIVRKGEKQAPRDLRGELFFFYDPIEVADDRNLEFAIRTWVERHMPATLSR